jgi:hypothetical protein
MLIKTFVSAERTVKRHSILKQRTRLEDGRIKDRLRQISQVERLTIIVCKKRICDVFSGTGIGSSDSTPLIFDKCFDVMDKSLISFFPGRRTFEYDLMVVFWLSRKAWTQFHARTRPRC